MGSPPLAKKRRHTFAEYLRLEEQSDEKHEFWDGEIVAMAGGTYDHSLITTNLIRALGNKLIGKPCAVLESNMRVRIPSTRYGVYPDLSVMCGKPVFDEEDPKRTTIKNPTLVVEVLSPSTEKHDRNVKFQQYLELNSIREIVLVSQDKPRVEAFCKQEGGQWLFSFWTDLAANALLRSLDIEIDYGKDIYSGVTFESEASRPDAT